MLNKIPHYTLLICRGFAKIYWTFENRTRLAFWGVKVSGRINSIGRIKVQLFPGSKVQIGKGATFRSKSTSNLIGINRPCILSTNLKKARIIIGNNCGFSGTVIGAFDSIEIGDNVRCGANTLITDSNWHLDDLRSGEPKEIKIESNVWLGVNSVVLKGVTIGENTVIGANSVVTKSIPANVVAAGNPCNVLRTL